MTSTPILKIVFMGTPEFAVPALDVLQAGRHQVQAVVTVPDKPMGRGRKLRSSAVKQAAEGYGLPVFQPENLKAETFLQTIRELAPDLIVVVAFQVLPVSLFTIPRYGSFNLHASLLPRYRGAAPIHWALLNGDTESGVSTFFLKRKVDTGNIILQRRVAIEPEDNLHTLYAKLQQLGARTVGETVDLIAAGQVQEIEQDPALATPAPKVTPATQQLNFTESAATCHNRVRAFAPAPAAFTHRQGRRLKILATTIQPDENGPAGSILAIGTDSFTVACGQGALRVTQVQPESKKAMAVSAYLRGYPMEIGEVLG